MVENYRGGDKTPTEFQLRAFRAFLELLQNRHYISPGVPENHIILLGKTNIDLAIHTLLLEKKGILMP